MFHTATYRNDLSILSLSFLLASISTSSSNITSVIGLRTDVSNLSVLFNTKLLMKQHGLTFVTDINDRHYDDNLVAMLQKN